MLFTLQLIFFSSTYIVHNCRNMDPLCCAFTFLLALVVCNGNGINRVTLPDDDRTYLIDLLQQTPHDMTVDRATELLYELENFYTGIRENLWGDCGPPYEIDKAFHLHIINTRLYAAFCESNFGRFIHHSPFWSRHPPPSDIQQRCGNQVQKLRDHGIDVKLEHFWALPTCGEGIEQNLSRDDRETIRGKKIYYCEL